MNYIESNIGWTYTSFMYDPFIASYLRSAVSTFPLKPNEFSAADLSMSSIEHMIEDCKQFKSDNEKLIRSPHLSSHEAMLMAGSHFWEARNLPDHSFPLSFWGVPNGPLLTWAAVQFKKTPLYVGIDGLIYISTGVETCADV